MKRPSTPPARLIAFVAIFVSSAWIAAVAAGPREGAVATVHARATEASVDAFRRGGNAVDAAIAAALTLGVVDGENSGIGGGCFALVRLPGGKFVALDGRETAPRAATRDMFVRDGRAVPELSTTGPLAVGVPGELAVLDWLARHHGRLPLREHLLAAAGVAADGVTVSDYYARRLAGEVGEIRKFPATARIFLKPDGTPWAAGDLLRQPDLAATYRAIATKGIGWFYRGTFARETESWMRANGGILTRRDFRDYSVRLREPVHSTYRGYEIVGFPPPSSGGVHVAQILNILGHFDIEALGDGSPGMVHVTAEAMKLAFADRAHWLGDSDFARVPRGLVNEAYAADLAGRIRMDHAVEVPGHGTPPGADRETFGSHTTHLSTADSDGLWVALTATINTTLGSKVVIPGTGVVLNNEMDDFSAQPGTANFFGLVGAEANAVAPRKRPLSSMSPTIVLRGGQPVLAVGAAGGPTIISQALLTVIQAVDFHRGPADALSRPRFHHQWRPDELVMESGWSDEAIRLLAERGHKLRTISALGATQAVGHDGKVFSAASDPRVGGAAAVWRQPDEKPPPQTRR